jgi:hypothetical protein
MKLRDKLLPCVMKNARQRITEVGQRRSSSYRVVCNGRAYRGNRRLGRGRISLPSGARTENSRPQEEKRRTRVGASATIVIVAMMTRVRTTCADWKLGRKDYARVAADNVKAEISNGLHSPQLSRLFLRLGSSRALRNRIRAIAINRGLVGRVGRADNRAASAIRHR